MLAIDAGHGMMNTGIGYDPGAVGNGRKEADIALEYALTMKQVCVDLGIPYKLTRSVKLQPAPLKHRVSRMKGAKALISFHCNSTPGATGTETLYSTEEKDARWCLGVQDAALKGLELRNRGIKDDATTRHGKLAILQGSFPSALLEIGFIDNRDDVQRMTERSRRLKVCYGIATAYIRIYGNKN
jgi:N-acetylmuramoyl-L-alanine amidase